MLDVIGGGKVYFADASGFAGTMTSGGGTSYNTSPTATYTANASVAAASLSGLVVVDGCTLTLTGGGTAAPDVLVLENGGIVIASTVDAAIVSMTGGSSDLAANLGAGATVLVQGANYYEGSSTASIVLAQGADLYANASFSGSLKGLGNLHDWNGLYLEDNETGFMGSYVFDGGSYVSYYTSALSGQANLNVGSVTDVIFFGSGNVVFAFGNLSGEAGPIDLSYNGYGPGGYTLLINETGTTTVTGLIGDAGYSSTVTIQGGGNLTWDVQGESSYPVYSLNVGTGTTVTLGYDTTANNFTIDGNVTNNGYMVVTGLANINGTLTNNGTIQNYGAIHIYGSVDSIGSIVNYAGSSIVVETGSDLYSWGDFENYGSVESAGQMYAQGIFNTFGTTTLDAGGGLAAWTNLSLGGPIIDNGTLLFWDGSQNMTYAGTVSGTGCIYTACGVSTVTLTGDNSSFAGLVYLGTGILQMGAGAPNSVGGGAEVLVTEGGTLDMNGNNLTAAGLLGGLGGTVTDNSATPGTSTLTLVLPPSYMDYTTSAIADGAHRNISVAVDAQTAGSPVEIFVASDTYTGGTVIGPGTDLYIGYGGTTGTIEGNVVDNGQLLFVPATPLVFAGAITGSGEVAVASFGSNGSVTLTADNSYTGGTWVGGTLIVGNVNALGSSAGQVTIFNGTLNLNGLDVSVGAVVGYYGTLTPGGGTGILTTGDLTLYSGMTYVAAINGGTAGTGYSQTQANGSVDLSGATLTLTGSGAASSSGPIVLIQSTGGVTGTFAGLAEGATVTYQGTTYQITYQYNPAGGTGTDVALVPV